VDDLKQVSVFSGNVVMTKGTLVIRADRLELRRDPEGYQYGTAIADSGRLVSFRQKREGVDEFFAGQAERIEYDGKAETIRLTNRAHLDRLVCEKPTDEVRGESITYDQKTEVYRVAGAAAGNDGARGRAMMVIQPGEQGRTSTAPSRCAGSAPAALKESGEIAPSGAAPRK
jgi:lipopolysaccharide export system protein LptA